MISGEAKLAIGTRGEGLPPGSSSLTSLTGGQTRMGKDEKTIRVRQKAVSDLAREREHYRQRCDFLEGKHKSKRPARGRLFGVEYPMWVIAAWNKIHNHRKHRAEVVAEYKKQYPALPMSSDHGFMEAEIRRHGWDCSCHPQAKAQLLKRVKSSGLYSYYF